MDLVVDASVIIAVISNEVTKPALIEATGGADLIAPVSVHFEIGNAFSAMFKRERITLKQAHEALGYYQEIPVRYVEIELVESLTIAKQLDIYAYDAYLIRSAERYRSPLLTLDEALRVHARTYGVQILEVQP
ncbi:MAG: type II toxin-antitoxin system VapC family toxin [Candidatus Promineifilaceae bacterium]|nr:type II toxin-antitoxin system VapC family toxin [Candidatus Promineifilaceae bacterium]